MSTAKLHKHFVEAAASHWAEAVLDGFFESGRAGDDELWGDSSCRRGRLDKHAGELVGVGSIRWRQNM